MIKNGLIFDKMYLLGVLVFELFMYCFPGESFFVVRVAPLLLCTVIYMFFLPYSLASGKFYVYRGVFSLSVFLLWLILDVYFISGVRGLVTLEVFYFVSWLFIFVVLVRIEKENHLYYLNALFVFFLLFQFFVVLGQLSKTITGFGLYHLAEYSELSIEESKRYGLMLSGTFFNANDLSSTVIMIICYFLVVKDRCSLYFKTALTLGFVLVVASMSRSILLIFSFLIIFFEARKSLLKPLLFIVIFFVVSCLLYYVGKLYFYDYDAVNRIVDRVDSIFLLIGLGVSNDNSISQRLDSYAWFFSHFGSLGLGTGTFANYDSFVNGIQSGFDIFSKKPHSLFVEVGYWLGLPGVFFIFIFFFSFFKFNYLFVFVFGVFFMVSLVSSSMIGKFMLMVAVFSIFICIQNNIRVSSYSSELKRMLNN